jgi:ankyrin repeat protein
MDPRGAPRSRDLLEAVQRGRQEELEERLRQGETPNTTFTLGRSPLHCAAANANLPATVALLEHGADVALLDSNGYSALHMACTRRAADTPAIVDRLIAAGAEVNLANR